MKRAGSDEWAPCLLAWSARLKAFHAELVRYRRFRPIQTLQFSSRGQLKTIRGFGVASVRGFPVRLPEHTVHSVAETELSLRGEEFALGVKAGAAVLFPEHFFFFSGRNMMLLLFYLRLLLGWKGCQRTN